MGVGGEPLVAPAGNVEAVAGAAVAFAANASSDRHNRNLHTRHFVPGVASEVVGRSIVDCKRRGRPRLTFAGPGDGQQRQTSTQRNPVALQGEDREEEVAEAE